MLKKFKKIAFWLVFLTLYFNIGWGLGYYYHYNVDTQTFESASWHSKLLGGHCAFFADNADKAESRKQKSILLNEVLFSFIWPFVLLASLLSWVGHFAFWIFRFIFIGGLVKLIFGIP